MRRPEYPVANPWRATSSRSFCRSSRSTGSAERREGSKTISSQPYSKQRLRCLVRIEEARIGIGIVSEDGVARLVIEPRGGRSLAGLEECRLSPYGPPVARDEQCEKSGIISEDHVALS